MYTQVCTVSEFSKSRGVFFWKVQDTEEEMDLTDSQEEDGVKTTEQRSADVYCVKTASVAAIAGGALSPQPAVPHCYRLAHEHFNFLTATGNFRLQ